MANVIVNDTNLTNIASAIREKNGESTTYKPSEMAAAILAITTGEGGVDIPEEAFLITGTKGAYAFYNGVWDWFLEQYGDKITTNALTSPMSMFSSSGVERIPFNLYITSGSVTQCFNQCVNLKEISDIYIDASGGVTSFGSMFQGCLRLREAPNITNVAVAKKNASIQMSSMFASCYSLRNLPSWVTNLYDNQDDSAAVSSNTYSFYSSGLQNCYSLDEAVDLPVFPGSMTSNRMANFVVNCNRLSRLTFKKVLGSPITAKWKSQTIDLSTVGYADNTTTAVNIVNYNSGITGKKMVTDDATYQERKDDPDWFAAKMAYSRYNHDSAVETINSLPDASAYLASSSGTNTIKFRGAAGSATDGGAINTLTEEEIAVAAAKGWTVTLV